MFLFNVRTKFMIMKRFDFYPQERAFVAESLRRYIGQLPEYMADNSLPHDVARVVLFQLAERNGTTLRFMSGRAMQHPTQANYSKIL